LLERFASRSGLDEAGEVVADWKRESFSWLACSVLLAPLLPKLNDESRETDNRESPPKVEAERRGLMIPAGSAESETGEEGVWLWWDFGPMVLSKAAEANEKNPPPEDRGDLGSDKVEEAELADDEVN
jgi:hypothetical protein